MTSDGALEGAAADVQPGGTITGSAGLQLLQDVVANPAVQKGAEIILTGVATAAAEKIIDKMTGGGPTPPANSSPE
ncbi:hypothetical protein [Streptomyces sp. NPDC058326]|uniref:hypothetical protein n=1 Tax=Streptomyces sp. NPDC058326 TaxID=3346447 RepID=UPI0036EC7309